MFISQTSHFNILEPSLYNFGPMFKRSNPHSHFQEFQVFRFCPFSKFRYKKVAFLCDHWHWLWNSKKFQNLLQVSGGMNSNSRLSSWTSYYLTFRSTWDIGRPQCRILLEKCKIMLRWFWALWLAEKSRTANQSA